MKGLLSWSVRVAARTLLVGIAWITAWIVYMVAMRITTYDGLLSLIFQPIMGMIVSTLAVSLALLLGLILRLPLLRDLWFSSRMWAIGLGMLSLLVLCFGYWAGLTQEYTNSESGSKFTGLNATAALGSYELLVFSIVNLPVCLRG